jgi:hypothetical protein
MSTRTAFTVVGTVVGAYFGNPALGAAIGSYVGGVVDPVKTKGPRLTDAQQQTSQDGVPIALTFGKVRIQGNVIASGPLVEHKKKDSGKGSGTENTTYTYTRTYAIGICEGPIGGISRIWKNGKLALDARPRTGSETIQEVHQRLLLNQFLNDHTLYYGDETQIPDSELQAALDADTVPAFRGLAYMVCNDEDVTVTQGAVATYEFEIVTTGSQFDTFEYVPTSYPGIMPWGIAPNTKNDPRFVSGSYLYKVQGGDGTTFTDFNTAILAAVGEFDKPPMTSLPIVHGWQHYHSSNNLGFYGAFHPWTDGATFDQNSNIELTLVVPRKEYSSSVPYWATGGGGNYWPCANFAESIWAANFTTMSPPGDQTTPGPQGIVGSGVLLYSGIDPGDEYDGILSCAGGPDLYWYGDYIINCTPVMGCGQFIDPDWMLIPGSVTVYVDRYGVLHSANDCVTVDGSFAQLAKLVLSEDGRGYLQAPLGPVLEVSSPENVASFWHNAYDLAVSLGEMPAGLSYPSDYPVFVSQACKCSLGISVQTGDVTLAEIVSKLSYRAGLLPQEINVAELTDHVIGFTVATPTNAADTINTLSPAFFFDGAEWDKKVQFIKRGHNHVETLSITDSIDSDDPRIKEVRAQDIELPKSMTLSYFDPVADYAVTTQVARRSAVTVSATGDDSVQIPVVMPAAEAAQAADILLKDQWAALSGTLEQTVSDRYSYLTSTDTIHVDSDGALFRVRLGEITVQDGTFAYSSTQDVQGAYTSNVEGYAPLAPDVGMDLPPSPTLALYFDLPALRDQDDQTGIYVAATGVVGKWPGALIELSRDGGLSWVGAITVTQASTVGQLMTSLDAWSPYIVSETETLDVMLTDGTLESIARSQLLNQGNGAVVGSGEIVQFQTATVIEAGEYHLSDGIVRGRKNTATPAHGPTENFALLSDLYFIPLERSDIGKALKFRATTLGTANSEGIIADFTFTEANSVTEWPVTHVRKSRDSANTVSLAWSPRHRLGNALNPYPSQYFNGFQITFSNGSTSKTYSVSAESFTYTSAMQTADFGGVINPLTFTIAATNSITGAGDAFTGTV